MKQRLKHHNGRQSSYQLKSLAVGGGSDSISHTKERIAEYRCTINCEGILRGDLENVKLEVTELEHGASSTVMLAVRVMLT